jgi:glycosyltransferase 2 family protein
MPKRKTIYLGLVVGLGFLYFAFQGTRIDRIWLNIRQVNFGFIAAAIAFIVAEMILRAYRWKFLLRPHSGPKVNQLFSVLMIGYLSNSIIPLRMGELVRAQFLGTNYQVNRARALGTIVVERVFDVLMLLTLFGFCLLLYDAFPDSVKRGGFLAAMGFASLVPLLYFYGTWRNRIVARLRKLTSAIRLGEKITGIIDNFGLGLTALNEFGNVLAIVCLSLLIWLTMVSSISMVLMAFPFKVSFLAGAFVTVMLGLGMLLPAPPANIGVYEGFAILALVPFGIEREAALSFSLVLHFLELAITISIGFVCFAREVGSVPAAATRFWPDQAK